MYKGQCPEINKTDVNALDEAIYQIILLDGHFITCSSKIKASAFLGFMVDWRSWINNYMISVIIEAVKEKSTMFQATAGAQPLL